jgi:hypothetical protein
MIDSYFCSESIFQINVIESLAVKYHSRKSLEVTDIIDVFKL